MSIFHPTPIACACGHQFKAALLQSANIRRMPALRAAILEGSFHRVVCPACGKKSNVESTFLYTDLDRQAVFLAYPRSRRFAHRTHQKQLQQAISVFPLSVVDSKKACLRLVYGLDELREKLVAQDAGYPDQPLEHLKAQLLSAHPFLTQQDRIQLFLHKQTRAWVSFAAYFHNQPELYSLTLPRSVADGAMASLGQWLASPDTAAIRAPATRLDGFWVNFRNWTSRYDALEVLHDLAADITAGRQPPLAGNDFEQLLATLPQGVNLSTPAKQDLLIVFNYAHAQGNQAVELRLLDIRFGKQVGNEWIQNTGEDEVPILWQVLRGLPASNVEGNTSLKVISLTDVNGGLYNSDGTVEIGRNELGNAVDFEEVLRHEVGHSVNEQFRAKVDAWLANEFGWKMSPVYGAGAAEWAQAIDAWVQAMGGWGTGTEQEHRDIARFLEDCLVQSSEHAVQTGDWSPVLTPSFPPTHAWSSDACLPAKAYRQSGGGNWWSYCGGWLELAGKRFAVNFYYGCLMEVNAKAIDNYVLKMPRSDHYGAMSMAEFFAELYSFYFDPPDHPDQTIEKPVLDWMAANIGPLNPMNPAPPPASD